MRYVVLIALAAFPLAVIYGALRDLVSFEVPNWVSLAVVLSFIVAMPGAGIPGDEIAAHFAVGLAVLAVAFFMFARGFIGGGDAKLLAGAALWMGWRWLAEFLILMGLAGGVLALLILIFRKVPLPKRLSAISWIRRLHGETAGVPYSLAIGAAALYLFPNLAVVSRALSD